MITTQDKIREVLNEQIFDGAFANLNELFTFSKITDMDYKTRIEELKIKEDLLIQALTKIIEEEKGK